MDLTTAPPPGPRRRALPRRGEGFTLVEMLVVMTVAALLAGVALPSFAEHWRQARRSDAVAALTRLQVAQEQYRAAHGVYAPQLSALRGVSGASDQGWYRLTLELAQPQQYRAVAEAVAEGSQAGDGLCARLVLQVTDGLADAGPEPRCWNR